MPGVLDLWVPVQTLAVANSTVGAVMFCLFFFVVVLLADNICIVTPIVL